MHILPASYFIPLVLIHAITTAASSPVPPVLAASAPLSLSPKISNQSLPFSDTALTTDLTALPDPYDERSPGVSTILEVYAYGHTFTALDTTMARLSIRAAINNVWSQSGDWSRQIGTERVLRYEEHSIWLVCHPRQPLTWRMWYEALTAMSIVVDRRGLRREFQFLILQEGMRREVGYGSLAFE